ncbi:MAG TPA: hypothetical protein VJ397_11095, partial [Thermoplasmata archaeon]|nr:hypothetical protein [Thermoplasmata archaeon]
SDAERAILRALSVHRLPAGFDALEGASPDALVPLKGRGLVHETSGRLELHDLVRDFVYSRLPREARLALHAAAAKYWEAAEPAEALHHRLQAEDWEGGARLALDVIPALAEDNPREAATLLGPLTRERVPADLWPDILYLHGFAEERVGEARAALETYGEVLRLEEARGGDKASLAILHQHIAQLKREFATFDEALQSHRSALRLFQEAGDREGAALELANVAALHRRRGDLAKARESLATALEAATKAQAPRAVAAVHYQGALVAVDSGDLGTAASRFRDAEREARAGADPAGAVLAKAGLLEVEFLRGNRTRAAQIAAELSALVPDDPTSRSAREGLMGFASLLGAAGEPEEALRYTFEASRRPTSRILHRPAPEAVDLEAASLAASLCRRLARWKEMVAQRDEAVRLAWALGRPARVGRELLERAIDAESRGDLDRALVALQESTKVLASAGSARGLAAAHLTWGRVLEKRDDPQAAEVHYEEAVRHAEAAADLLGQARALEVLGEVAGPRGRDSLRRARVIYAQLGRAADEARVVRLLAP